MTSYSAIASLPNLLIRLWKHLSRRRQSQFILVLGLMMVSAIAEIISLGSVLPFLGVLISPDKVFNHPWASGLIEILGLNSPEQLVFPLTVGFAIAALISGGVRMLLLWASTQLASASGTEFSLGLYQRSLYQPYEVHVARNSSEVISGVTDKVSNGIEVIAQMLILVSSIILLLAITITLVIIDPMVALIAGTGFGASYALIAWSVRKKLKLNSIDISIREIQVIKALQEGLGGIRDVLLDGTQPVYCDIYHKADRPLRQARASNRFIMGSPRFLMEAIGITLIAGLAYGLSHQAGGIASALPTLGALALGAQRLLPILQQGFGAWANIMGSHASLADTIELLEQPLPDEATQPKPKALRFQNNIRLENVFFRYVGDGPWVLENLNLNIPKGSRIGFVGTTGSGKSTMIDLLMGLLTPTKGKLLVDDQPITGNLISAWQQAIAHVPQSVYLSDSTLAENIAFGVPLEQIDMENVLHAGEQARISEFIKKRTDGYYSIVGEQGIRISGGQRQRIGIARALYQRASVLVFDEATSALDNLTEKSVMNAIEGLGQELTLLIIAHRLTTVKRCDLIVELEKGKVVAQGTYDELLESSPSFRKMAQETK